MIGAFLAGIIYKRYKNKYLAVGGEIIGIGILGGLIAFPIAKYIMGNQVVGLFLIRVKKNEFTTSLLLY